MNIEIIVGYTENSKILRNFNAKWLSKPKDDLSGVEEVLDLREHPIPPSEAHPAPIKLNSLSSKPSIDDVLIEKKEIEPKLQEYKDYIGIHPKVAEIPIVKIQARSNEYIRVIDSRDRTSLFELQGLKCLQLKVLEDFLRGHLKQVNNSKWL